MFHAGGQCDAFYDVAAADPWYDYRDVASYGGGVAHELYVHDMLEATVNDGNGVVEVSRQTVDSPFPGDDCSDCDTVYMEEPVPTQTRM